MCVYLYMYVRVHMCVRHDKLIICMQTYMHTHTHTHTHHICQSYLSVFYVSVCRGWGWEGVRGCFFGGGERVRGQRDRERERERERKRQREKEGEGGREGEREREREREVERERKRQRER